MSTKGVIFTRSVQSRKIEILDLLERLGQINSQIVAQELDCTNKQASQSLKYLQKLKLIRPVGRAPRTKMKTYVEA